MKYVKKELIIIMISVMGMSFSSLLIAMTHSQLANKIKKIDALMKDTRKKMKAALVSASKGENFNDLEKEIKKNEERIKIFLQQFQAAGLKGYASKYAMQWESMLFGEVEKTLESLLENEDKEGIQRVMSYVSNDAYKARIFSDVHGGRVSPSESTAGRAEIGHRGGQTIKECGGEKMTQAFTDHLAFLFGKKNYEGFGEYLMNLSNSGTFLKDVEFRVEDIGKIISQIYYKNYPPRSSKNDALLKGDWIKVLQNEDPEGTEVVLGTTEVSGDNIGYQLKRYQEHNWSEEQSDIHPDESPKEHQTEQEPFPSNIGQSAEEPLNEPDVPDIKQESSSGTDIINID